MALKPEMTWEKAKLRWRKMYRGKVYTISCEALGAPTSKEASATAANAWWRQKRAELDSTLPEQKLDASVIDLQRRHEWARQHGEHATADRLGEQLAEAKKISGRSPGTGIEAVEQQEALSEYLVTAPDLDERIKGLEELGVEFPHGLSRILLDRAIGERGTWNDRLRQAKRQHVPEDRTVGGQVKAWMGTLEVRVKARKLAADRYDNIRRNIERFRDYVGTQVEVTSIDESRIEGFYHHLLGKVAERIDNPKGKDGMSASYADSIWGHAKTFVRYLWRKRLIELPRNLEDRAYRFDLGPTKIETFTVEEVRTLVEKATGQLKLHLYLMANCGFGPSDIAQLKDQEVDWDRGRISRKRSKTRKHGDVPEVLYKLWQPTFELLKSYRSGQETVLLTKTGRLWVFEELTPEGKLRSTDSVATNFNRLKATLGKRGIVIDKPLKSLRKTSATLIESHETFGRYVSHFLGHSPRTIRDKHYAAPAVELFDEIMDWLGRQYGFVV
jgi:integrase